MGKLDDALAKYNREFEKIGVDMTQRTERVQKRLVKSAKTNSNRVHITPRPNGWAIRKESNLQASKVFTTLKAAIDFAKAWVQTGKASSVIVHRRNGTFRTAK